MDKSLFRKLSIYLAFIQMFSSGIKAFADAPIPTSLTNEETVEEKITAFKERPLFLVNDKNPNNLIYKRLNEKTGKLENISIFDNENIPSKQYGANQGDYSRKSFKTLLDPLVWEQVQQDFPISDYGSKAEAVKRYDKLFKIIGKVGCGFAAGVDLMFRMHEGKEEQFYKKFGYPMYTVYEDEIDFNYEPLMYAFFSFKTKKQFGSLEALKGTIEHQIAQDELDEAERQLSFMTRDFGERSKWDKQKWDDYKAIYVPLRDKVKECKKILAQEYVEEDQYGIMADKTFGYLKEFLSQHGTRVSIELGKGLAGTKPDTILARHIFTLYHLNVYGQITHATEDIPNHYVYATGKTEDGDYIVSSLGEKCIMGDKSEWTYRLIPSFKK